MVIDIDDMTKKIAAAFAGLLVLVPILKSALTKWSAESSITSQNTLTEAVMDSIKARLEKVEEENQKLWAKLGAIEAENEKLHWRVRSNQETAVEIYATAYSECPFCQKTKALAQKIYRMETLKTPEQ